MRKVARRCEDCRRACQARYRAIADRFLCADCAAFFSDHGRLHTTSELHQWLGEEPGHA